MEPVNETVVPEGAANTVNCAMVPLEVYSPKSVPLGALTEHRVAADDVRAVEPIATTNLSAPTRMG